jgi:hypothetical protein
MQILPAYGRKFGDSWTRAFGIFSPLSLGQSLKSRPMGAEKVIFKNKLTDFAIGVLARA